MAYSADDIAALERAIATGARKVRQGSEEVEYRSLAEMQATLRAMRAQVGGGVRKISATYPATSRGV